MAAEAFGCRYICLDGFRAWSLAKIWCGISLLVICWSDELATGKGICDQSAPTTGIRPVGYCKLSVAGVLIIACWSTSVLRGGRWERTWRDQIRIYVWDLSKLTLICCICIVLVWLFVICWIVCSIQVVACASWLLSFDLLFTFNLRL